MSTKSSIFYVNSIDRNCKIDVHCYYDYTTFPILTSIIEIFINDNECITIKLNKNQLKKLNKMITKCRSDNDGQDIHDLIDHDDFKFIKH
jgi:hypothetical protein